VSEFETEENTEGGAEAAASPEKSPEGTDAKQSMNREVIQNIPITLAIEVGRASLKIRDLMRLTQGSVVELDRLAGEPLDIVVNDTVVAQGEVVLVNDRYGVRLTKVVSAADRIKNL
jgi:flagellar motor switch protein FliN/FliY